MPAYKHIQGSEQKTRVCLCETDKMLSLSTQKSLSLHNTSTIWTSHKTNKFFKMGILYSSHKKKMNILLFFTMKRKACPTNCQIKVLVFKALQWLSPLPNTATIIGVPKLTRIIIDFSVQIWKLFFKFFW